MTRADDISSPDADAWKPEIGDTIRGVVTWEGLLEVRSFDGKRTERKLKVVLDTDGGPKAVWATVNTDIDGSGFPKRDARAIVAAIHAAGAEEIKAGGTLEMTRIDDVPTDYGPAKAYEAVYQPPKELKGSLAGITG